MQEIFFTCKEEKIRLDHFLTKEMQSSRNQIIELIRLGNVQVNDKAITKAGYKLNMDDVLCVKLNSTKKDENREFEVDFDVPIIYEDDDILVVNKPPFLTVHPAPSVKELTLVDWLKSKNISLSTLSGEERYGIVHRIDKETSGALVIAKNNASHIFLSKQLEDKTMGRYYLGLIDKELKNDVIVEKPIARNPKNRTKMAIVQDGREAKSAFFSLLKAKQFELILAKLYTGRTHQIRVHLNSIGRHILGDDLYGFKSQNDKINRVMLHAYCLYLTHPKSKQNMTFIAPLYGDFREILDKNFNKEDIDETLKIDTIFSRINTIY
ncbi:MAG: RluA family pseudouridine synthase [Campylobacteraceae bacterium]|jgi:23S rRNA pseudouridine1911/1915/1917 synthase|nr:RluA family pseudouridine synthase [Campylobacteraceae bacterium]